MHTIRCAMFIGMMFALLSLASGEARAEKRIGIFMFSEETRYVEASQGFKERLAEAGFDANQVTYFVENAGGNKAQAAIIVKKFLEQKPDMIFALGTSAAVPLSQEIKDIPIVFSMVYDPVEAGIANNWQHSGNNTTGCSPLIPMSKLMDALKKIAPVKNLAVLYTPGEKNSESQLRDLLEIQDTYQLKVLPVRLTKKEDVKQLLPALLLSADALYITGSNLVNSQIQTIVDMATKAKVITITHLEDLIQKGVLLGMITDSHDLGRLTGEKALEILAGANPSDVPIATGTKNRILLNMHTVKKGGYSIPAEFLDSVTKTIE